MPCLLFVLTVVMNSSSKLMFPTWWFVARIGEHKVRIPVPTFSSSFGSLGLKDHYKIYITRRDCPPISGKPGQSMVPHLSKCVLVEPEIRPRNGIEKYLPIHSH